MSEREEIAAQISSHLFHDYSLLGVDHQASTRLLYDALAEIEQLVRERDEARAEVAELARARHYLKDALRGSHSIESCKDPECPICGIILCPFDADEHLWKDGCPACYCTPVEPEREH